MKPQYQDGFFSLDRENGFLPLHAPMATLPKDPFHPIQEILTHMTIHQKDGSSGYLATEGKLSEVINELPNFLELIQPLGTENDIRLIQALYRGYCFLSSAYLLEPSYHHYLKTHEYGAALNRLPSNLAQPLCYLAKILDVHPWMEYSYGYSLGNYVKHDPKGILNWQNLDMAVSFSGTSDETGFIMVHVDINQNSPDLVRSVMDLCETPNLTEQPEKTLNALKLSYQTMIKINERRREMWSASNHHKYNDFRIFIMGIQGNQKVFGDGVIYEGTETNEIARQYRGQSGSQDTIIPMMDICFQVTKHYPQNELTAYLLDMRQYRPKPFRDFLDDLQLASENLAQKVEDATGTLGLIYYLANLNEIYHFRNGHWQFVQKYIMSNTKYPVATGGTPIISWVPNQIEATLMTMKDIMEKIPENCQHPIYKKISQQYPKQVALLKQQIAELKQKDYNIDLIHDLNKQYDALN